MNTRHSFNVKVAKAAFITILMILGFALIIKQADFFFLVFAGIFFSVILNYSANWVQDKLKVSYSWALVVVLLLIVIIFTTMFMLLGPSISEQVSKMIETLPKSIENFKAKLMETEIGRMIVGQLPDKPEDVIGNDKKLASRIMGSFASGLGAMANIAVVLITGIFFAANPSRYRNGFVSLFAKSFRPKLEKVMDKAHETLSLWMFAKLISMTIVGVMTAIGLIVLGVPLPFALALIAGLLSFIPNIGPFLGFAPALLIALLEGMDTALYVTILYFVIQVIESYLITPLVEKKIVSLPPALTLLWLLLIGLLSGIVGLILAAPLLAVVIIVVKELYVEDYLGGAED